MKHFLVKAGRAFVAALTSPDAVTAEKSLAVLVLTRALLAVGASDGLVRVIEAAIKAAN